MRSPHGSARQLALLADANPVCVRSCYCGRYGEAGACPGAEVSGILQPSDPDFGSRLGEVGGLDILATQARPQDPLLLPAFLPQVDGGAAVRGRPASTVVVTLARLREQLGVPLRKSRTLQERLNLDPGVRVGIFLTGPDPLLEDLWTRRSLWLDAFTQLRPDFVVGPTYSVWRDDYALEGLYSIRRSVYFFGLLQQRGLPSIVNVYWREQDDIAVWQRWLAQNPVEAIAMDLQCLGQTEVPTFLRELAELRSGLSRPVRLVVNGLTAGRRLDALIAVWPSVTVTSNLYVLAGSRRRRVPRRDGSFGRGRSDDPPGVLHGQEVAQIERWLSARLGHQAA